MADTQRTWTEMDALLSTAPTNVVGVQTVRDGFYTLYNRTGVYCSLYASSSAEQALTGTYAPLGFGSGWLAGASSGVSADADGAITVEQSGVYMVQYAMLFEVSTDPVYFAVDVNGTLVDTTVPESKTSGNSTAQRMAIVELAAGDVVTLIAKDTGASETMVASGQFVLYKIA